jgi:hypothetical protein
MFGMSAFLLFTPRRHREHREISEKEKEMNTQTETNLVDKVAEAPREIENPMQERPSATVDESDVLTAEAVIAARRLEVQKEAGRTSTLLFVP